MGFKISLVGLFTITISLSSFIINAHEKLILLQKKAVEYEVERSLILQKIEGLEKILSELAVPIEITTTPTAASPSLLVLLTGVAVVGIIVTCYMYSSSNIFCPVLTMSQLDKYGNQILIGINYPSTLSVKAAIRLVGTDEVIGIDRFARTVAENPVLKQTVLDIINSL